MRTVENRRQRQFATLFTGLRLEEIFPKIGLTLWGLSVVLRE